MADLVDAIQTELRQRLEELKPLVAEHERLERALASLGSLSQPSDSQRLGEGSRSRTGRRNTPGRSGRRRRTSPKEAEKRREHIVAILKEDSKTRPSALATTLGISSQNVQQDLRKLREAGRNPQDG